MKVEIDFSPIDVKALQDLRGGADICSFVLDKILERINETAENVSSEAEEIQNLLMFSESESDVLRQSSCVLEEK